jgi:hypothetical protein
MFQGCFLFPGSIHERVFLLSEKQISRISPFIPMAHGISRVDDRRVISGIVYGIRYGQQWK